MEDLQIEVPNGMMSNKVLLKDTLHALDLCLTIVSIGCIVMASYTVQFAGNSCKIKGGQDNCFIGRISVGANRLFRVEHTFAATDNLTSAEAIDILMLHHRLGHISVNAIHALIHTSSIISVHVIDDFPPFICDSCEYAKMTHKQICKERVAPQAQAFEEEVHTNVWGPSPTLS